MRAQQRLSKGGPNQLPLKDVVVLHRSEIERLGDTPKPLRDQLIIDLPKRMGFRTREIGTFRWEYIDMDEGYTYVLDSKRNQLLRVPLDWKVAQLLTEYNGGRNQGLVLQYLPSAYRKKCRQAKPLTNVTIENTVKFYAEKLGIPNWKEYTPRLLRCFFAAEWIRESLQRNRRVNLKVLQVIMRHKHIETTWRYVNRIIFWEDMQAEFQRIQGGPIERRLRKFSLQVLESVIVRQCMTCLKRDVCKHFDEMIEAAERLPLEEVRCKYRIPETALAKDFLEACRHG